MSSRQNYSSLQTFRTASEGERGCGHVTISYQGRGLLSNMQSSQLKIDIQILGFLSSNKLGLWIYTKRGDSSSGGGSNFSMAGLQFFEWKKVQLSTYIQNSLISHISRWGLQPLEPPPPFLRHCHHHKVTCTCVEEGKGCNFHGRPFQVAFITNRLLCNKVLFPKTVNPSFRTETQAVTLNGILSNLMCGLTGSFV